MKFLAITYLYFALLQKVLTVEVIIRSNYAVETHLSETDLPHQIKKIMRHVTDFPSFIRAFNLPNNVLNIPEPSNNGERNFGDKVAVLENECCMPRPVVNKIPQPNDPNSFYYPYSVSLHKCSGSCDQNPFGTVCVPRVNSSVLVRVAHISWQSQANDVALSPQISHVTFSNETDCTCKCKHDSSACNQFQYWDERHCKCRCNGYCTGNFVTHPEQCCYCPKQSTCAKKQFWSWEKCACLCKKKKPCKQPGKVRDPYTCKCRCPKIYCRYGADLDEKTCRCQMRSNLKK